MNDSERQRLAEVINRVVPAPPTRKTRLPRGHQWVHHEKAGSRAALRRLRQMGQTTAPPAVGGPPAPAPASGSTGAQDGAPSHER